SQEGHSQNKARNAAQRPFTQGEEPQTSDRDWPVEGTQERRQGAEAEELNNTRACSSAAPDSGECASGWPLSATRCPPEATTAHLTNAIDDRYYELERVHGEQGARFAAESHTAAINRIESIVKKENIDCDFERLDGYLFLPPGEKEEILDRELAAAHRAGLVDVEKVVYAPLKAFDTGPALRFPNQGQFHPLNYLAALAKAIKRDGGQIYTKTHADRIDG